MRKIPGMSYRQRTAASVWPIIIDSRSAAAASSSGAGACFVISAITASVAVAAICLHHPVFGMDGGALWDAAIFGILGYFIGSLHSRIAAILAALLFVAEKVYQYKTGQMTGFSAVAFFLAIYLVNGIRGTFAYAEFQQSSGSSTDLVAPPGPGTDVLLCSTQETGIAQEKGRG